MKRPLLVCAVFISLWSAEAHTAGLIRGTIWNSRGEARRAELAREKARAAKPQARGLFDFLGTPALRKTPAAPASASGDRTGGAARAGGSRGSANASTVKPPVPRLQPGVTDAVISVRRIPESAERRLAQRVQRDRRRHNPRMVIQKSRYKPRVMAAAAGSDVEFQNLDRIWHSTFSVSSAQPFDLGKLKPGAMDTVTLARPGVINLHCDIHPEETGFLVVVPNHAYARPDSLGRFELPRLPAGSYQVEIWHPLRGVRDAMVVVPSRGDAECDLAF